MPSDVRRSARGAPPTAKPPPPESTTSSSSLSSHRQDRTSKLSSNPKSATPRSLSSEDISEPPRRSQRSHLAKDVEASKDILGADEEAIDEEEITRCICGHQEYPGPPLSEAFADADAHTEDAGGLFISCDGCSVWQHGGCVGIIEESKVPDKYYCEECRPKLHELHIDANGQNYSLYQPVNGKSTRKASMSKHGEKGQRERDALRASAESTSGPGRRRGTMRSKEHDEEEELVRRAIEESKREIEGSGTGKRGGKRARDDSEDTKQGIKRQRTASESIPSNMRKASQIDSDEESSATRVKQVKAEGVHSARQPDAREKEKEREKIRAEAAGRRQERAGRRRVDDEPVEETPRPSTSAKTSPPPSSQPGSPREANGEEKVPVKRTWGGKRKKLGNNQYTNKAREASSPHGKKRTGAGTSSGEDNLPNGDSHHDSANVTRKNSPEHATGKGKFGKGRGKGVNGNGTKHEDPADLSVATMKRRMEAMSTFIARAQMELSGAKTPSHDLGTASPAGTGGAVQLPALRLLPATISSGKAVEEMNALEMADVVSQSIAGWHSQFDHLV